ncbi:MAG: hypothetical protein BWY31_04373 [Lentisphaerae bacterium ADurb.Bin242]|nr:MAG: hypothetical protein BWY31_04373 [Lentisphaerae bacterium ADurb.Bin242]
MLTEEKIKAAFDRAVERENRNLSQYAHKTGVPYTIIHNLKSGKTGFSRMTVATLSRMFPEMRVFFFREDFPAGGVVSVGGANLAPIANGSHADASVHVGEPVSRPKKPDDGNRPIDRDELETQFLNAEEFSPDEKIKILLFLKNKVK